MEHSISSLEFNGTIVEAIVEAKRQKKLFVVYISDQECGLTSTCTDPQKSAPCITVIGYNGVQLWQNEGFITAEVLAFSLEKAWLNLHIQETTASFLTAALTSKKSEQLASGLSDSSSPGQGTSSSPDVPSPSTDRHVHSSEARKTTNSETADENKQCEHPVKEINSKVEDEVFPAPALANESESGRAEESSPSTVKESLDPVKTDPENTSDGHKSASVEDGCPVPEEKLVDLRSGANVATSRVIANEAVQGEKAETFKDNITDGLDLSASKSNDVHLNIRLPDCTSLQEKFSVTCTLRMVKDYVDEKQESSIGSYDLAIPYPRKVFNDQDLSKTLSELGLFNRQALIVVPHSRAIGHHKEGSSSSNQTTAANGIGSSSGSSEGYLSFVKRIISYVNPFSYLGGGTSSASTVHESQNSMWQYCPNPTLQNNLRETSRPDLASSNQTTPATVRNTRRPTSSPFGSNIHSLKHDEDDSHLLPKDRNAFWNGNSTEYGGGDNDKK